MFYKYIVVPLCLPLIFAGAGVGLILAALIPGHPMGAVWNWYDLLQMFGIVLVCLAIPVVYDRVVARKSNVKPFWGHPLGFWRTLIWSSFLAGILTIAVLTMVA